MHPLRRLLRRREILRLGGVSLATGVGLSLRGTGRADEPLLRELLVANVGTPQNLSTPLEAFDRLITPTSVFFVRSHFGPPALDPNRKLRITGLVEKTLELRAADLSALPEVTLTAVLQCAGNGRSLHEPRVPGVQWVHGGMAQASWTGVRLKDLLAKAKTKSGAAHVHLLGADLPPKPTVPKFLRSIPLARAIDDTTLVAYRMNGEPLSLAHGAPLRLVVPGWAGDHWVKWLTELHVDAAEAPGFYMQTGYKMPKDPVAPGAVVLPDQMVSLTTFPVKSIVSRPSEGSRLPPGPQEIVGVAFSGDASLAKVEVSLDGGASWTDAALEGEPGIGRWQVYRHRFDAKPGKYTAMARATDARGNVQPQKAAWNPSGYFWNAWHAVAFEVAT